MRITYTVDKQGMLWACIYRTDGKYDHWFLGSQSLATRKQTMYEILNKHNNPADPNRID